MRRTCLMRNTQGRDIGLLTWTSRGRRWATPGSITSAPTSETPTGVISPGTSGRWS